MVTFPTWVSAIASKKYLPKSEQKVAQFGRNRAERFFCNAAFSVSASDSEETYSVFLWSVTNCQLLQVENRRDCVKWKCCFLPPTRQLFLICANLFPERILSATGTAKLNPDPNVAFAF